MTKYAKLIHPQDNVVTVVAPCQAGDQVVVRSPDGEQTYACNQEVPFGHKIAIAPIQPGGPVRKYGEVIGSATGAIAVGDWVHIHNLRDDYLCLGKDGSPLPGQEGSAGGQSCSA